jgi:hypothetical protein
LESYALFQKNKESLNKKKIESS